MNMIVNLNRVWLIEERKSVNQSSNYSFDFDCFQEALQESQRQSERTHRESINQIIRERDAICEEKLAAQKKSVYLFFPSFFQIFL